MKRFFLVKNPEKEGTEEVTAQIGSYLAGRGAECIPGPWHKESVQHAWRYTNPQDVPADTQCVITLGGDGTLIQAARDLVSLNIPFLGINLGTLGFLTQATRQEDLKPVLDALLLDQIQLEKRMMISGTIRSGDNILMADLALNEIVITRKDTLRVLKFQVYLNGTFFNEYTADGVIIATPTGSTAYNLSAGGPIVTPAARLMVMTPICAHTLNTRSIVLSPEDEIVIRMIGDGEQHHTAVFDGDVTADLGFGDTVEIRQADRSTNLIKLKDVSFLDNLRSKMVHI